MKKMFITFLFLSLCLYGCGHIFQPVLIYLETPSGDIHETDQLFPLKNPQRMNDIAADVEMPLPMLERIAWAPISFSIPADLNLATIVDDGTASVIGTTPERPGFMLGASKFPVADFSLEAEFANLLNDPLLTDIQTDAISIAGLSGLSAVIEFDTVSGQMILLESADTFYLFSGQDETSAWENKSQAQFQAMVESVTVDQTNESDETPKSVQLPAPTAEPTSEPTRVVLPTPTVEPTVEPAQVALPTPTAPPVDAPRASTIDQTLPVLYTYLTQQTNSLVKLEAERVALAEVVAATESPSWETINSLYWQLDALYTDMTTVKDDLFSAEETFLALYNIAQTDAEVTQIDTVLAQLHNLQTNAETIQGNMNWLYGAIAELEDCVCEES